MFNAIIGWGKIERIDALLATIDEVASNDDPTVTEQLSHVQLQTNEIFLVSAQPACYLYDWLTLIAKTVYNHVLRTRAVLTKLYGTDAEPGPTTDPWLSSPPLLNALNNQLSRTAALLKRANRDSSRRGPDVSKPNYGLRMDELEDDARIRESWDRLRDQFGEVCNFSFAMYEERRGYLRRLVSISLWTVHLLIHLSPA